MAVSRTAEERQTDTAQAGTLIGRGVSGELHPVTEMLNTLENCAVNPSDAIYRALALSFDNYTFGTYRRAAQGLIHSGMAEKFRQEVRLFLNKSLTSQQAEKIREALQLAAHKPQDTSRLAQVFREIKKSEHANSFSLGAYCKGYYFDQQGGHEKWRIPHEAWRAVAHVHDKAQLSCGLMTEDDVKVSLLAYVGCYPRRDHHWEEHAQELADALYLGNIDDAMTALALADKKRAKAYEAEMTYLTEQMSPTLVQFDTPGVDAYRWTCNPAGQPNTGVEMQSPMWLARMALAAEVRFRTHNHFFPNDFSQTKGMHSDVWLWLIYQCVVDCQSAGQQDVARILSLQSSNFDWLNKYIHYVHPPVQKQFSRINEVNTAEAWFKSGGKPRAAVLEQGRTQYQIGAHFARKVWGQLLEHKLEQVRHAAIVAAASKLGIAHGRLKSESNLRNLFRSWTGPNRPGTYENWYEYFDKTCTRPKPEPTTKALTDQILVAGRLAAKVTGITSGIHEVKLVRMARSVYFSHPSTHEEQFLKHELKALNPEVWNASWEDKRTDLHEKLQTPAIQAHQLLYGPAYFSAVEDCMAKNLEDIADQHKEMCCYWARHLLYIPFHHPDGGSENTGHALIDRPDSDTWMATIRIAFGPLLGSIGWADGPNAVSYLHTPNSLSAELRTPAVWLYHLSQLQSIHPQAHDQQFGYFACASDIHTGDQS